MVRLVVTALESASPGTTGSRDRNRNRAHCCHILGPGEEGQFSLEGGGKERRMRESLVWREEERREGRGRVVGGKRTGSMEICIVSVLRLKDW